MAVTTIRGADNVRQYFPNTMMTGAAIINLSRSDNKFDNFTVRVPSMYSAGVLLTADLHYDLHPTCCRGTLLTHACIACTHEADTQR